MLMIDQQEWGGDWESKTNLFVVITLYTGYKTQSGQYLWLDSQGDVKIFDNIIYPKWYPCPCPQDHHRRLKANCIMATVVNDDLWYKLQDISLLR